MVVSAMGLHLCEMVYFFLGEEVGELDSLIFSSLKRANFYFLIIIIKLMQSIQLQIAQLFCHFLIILNFLIIYLIY